jgi:uncharacterized protein
VVPFKQEYAHRVEEGEDILPYSGDTIELQPVVRDNLVLAIPMKVVCQADCKGLCQQCGRDLNRDPCACAQEVVDPRWALLQQLKTEKGGD